MNDFYVDEDEILRYKNGVPCGVIAKDVDGYFYWWPDRESYGSWSAHAIRQVADLLDTMNAQWDKEIKDYFEETDNERPYTNPNKPGRLDVNGVEWYACDPYPTWFRWEDGQLYTYPARWADLPEPDPKDHAIPPEECYGNDNHGPDCDQVIKAKWSGVRCDCGVRWYCL